LSRSGNGPHSPTEQTSKDRQAPILSYHMQNRQGSYQRCIIALRNLSAPARASWDWPARVRIRQELSFLSSAWSRCSADGRCP